MASFERGTKITFTARFTPVDPDSATLRVRLNKTVNRREATEIREIAMTFDTDKFVAELDTAGLRATTHSWVVYTDDAGRAVSSGQFTITAGAGNPF